MPFPQPAPDPGAIPQDGLLALFGPTGVGKTAVALCVADALRAAGRTPVAVSADALQVYQGLEIITGVPTAAERARLEHQLVSIVPVDATFSVGQYAELAHAEIDALLEQGATPIVVGGTGLYLRAALAELELRPQLPRDVRARWEAELDLAGPAPLHALLEQRAPWAAAEIDQADRHRIVRALALLDMGELEPPDGPNRLWTAETRRPTRLVGLVRERDELYARIDARVLDMIRRGAIDEVRAAQAAGASETARKALGFDELLAGDAAGMQRRTRNFAKRQLTWMRKLAGVEVLDITGRDPQDVAAAILSHAWRAVGFAAMRFEKWQALGNDYLIVERDQLPMPLTEAVARRLCHPHLGVGADGVLELSPPDAPGFVARLRIFNQDGSEAEMSGNGSRQAILYLHRRGWTTATQFSIQTLAGEIRPTITSPTTCTVDMGRARTRSEQYPTGDADGRGTLVAGGREWAFQHVSVGNPQCAIEVASVEELNAIALDDHGPEIEHSPLFPSRTNVSWWTEIEPGFIRARIFERGVGATMSSGTGACGAAAAYVLRGGDSPVRVALDGGELEVTVEEDLHIDLSGWAVPVYAGEASDELVQTLRGLAR